MQCGFGCRDQCLQRLPGPIRFVNSADDIRRREHFAERTTDRLARAFAGGKQRGSTKALQHYLRSDLQADVERATESGAAAAVVVCDEVPDWPPRLSS